MKEFWDAFEEFFWKMWNELYKYLSEKYSMDIIASGGVSSLSDIQRLSKANIAGAIIGKAYYTGAIDLKEAIEVAK